MKFCQIIHLTNVTTIIFQVALAYVNNRQKISVLNLKFLGFGIW